jgi:hypothetical protein
MATESPFDFNQSGYASDSTAGFDSAPRQRPGGLTAICVIAIVLGGLGLCSSLFGLAALAFQDNLEKFAMQQQQMPQGMPNGPFKQQMEAQQKMQKEMQKGMTEVGHRYRGFTIGTTLLNVLFASSLLIGGIMVMKLNPAGRKFLVTVFIAVIVFEIVRAAITVVMQLDMAAAMASAIQGGPNNQQAAFLATTMKLGVYLGMAFGVVWGLAKIIFYGIGASYLNRPNTRQLFERTAGEPT